MKKASAIALSGVMCALACVLMWVGYISGLGTFAAPMLAGIALIPVGISLGKRYHALCWVAVSLLCVFISADWEQNLMFICLFGWYPLIKPVLDKRPKAIRLLLKLLIFNVAAVGIELLVMLVIAPAAEETWLLLTLLLLGNVMFVMYDYILPRAEMAIEIKLGAHGIYRKKPRTEDK